MRNVETRREMLDALEAHIQAQLRLKAVLEVLVKKLPSPLTGWADDAVERIDQAVLAARKYRDLMKGSVVATERASQL